MDKDRQKLQQKVFECIDLCWEQNLEHELSLLSMVAGCLLTDDTPDESPSSPDPTQLGFEPDIHL